MKQQVVAGTMVALLALGVVAGPARAEDAATQNDVQGLERRVRAGRWIVSMAYLLGAGVLTLGALTWRDIRQNEAKRKQCDEQECPRVTAGDKVAGSVALTAGVVMTGISIYETLVVRDLARELERRRASVSVAPALSQTSAGMQVRLVW